MRAVVRLRTQDGAEWELGHGDLIGRLETAALLVDDARVSEAHAMVSLRGGELRLLGLRGRFSLGGQPVGDAALSVGQRLWLAPGLYVDVVHVALPDRVMALVADGQPPVVLGGVCSVLPGATLAPRFEPGALARLWSLGGVWRLQVGEEAARDLALDERFEVDGVGYAVTTVPLRRAGREATRAESSGQAPLRIVASFDAVVLHRDGHAPVTLVGVSARMVSELVALGGTAPWEVVAGEVWGAETDRGSLRRRWDVALARLRGRLRDEGVRGDLITAWGTGSVGLLLLPGDVVEDRT
jgi:hypothetical protein